MTTRIIRTDEDLQALTALLSARKRPFTVQITTGANRSIEQNALAFLWYREIAEQMGDRTATEVRAHCKLHHGVKMLVTENGAFRAAWHARFLRWDYEAKLELMVEPLDLPVTRLMTTKQLTQYLDAIADEFTRQGVVLTQPEDRRAA